MIKNRGFTLIELLIVIALLGILAGIAAPAFMDWVEGAKYREVASDVFSKLRTAKSLAVSTNKEHQVHFYLDVDPQRFTLEAKNSSTGLWDPIGATVELPAYVVLRSTDSCSNTSSSVIQFNPNGTSNQLYICIMEKNALTARYKIRVYPSSTGHIAMKKL